MALTRAAALPLGDHREAGVHAVVHPPPVRRGATRRRCRRACSRVSCAVRMDAREGLTGT